MKGTTMDLPETMQRFALAHPLSRADGDAAPYIHILPDRRGSVGLTVNR